MSGTFDCPACGAPLYVDENSAGTIRCQYCQKSVIVPEEMRGKSARPKPAAAAGSFAGLDLDALVGQAAALKEVVMLARNGRKIEAIKRYRELTGAGLAESKDAVESLERGEPLSFGSINLQSSETEQAPDLTSIQPQIREFLAGGKKIEAIKLYRQATGLGLKESKDAIDAMEAGMRGPRVTVLGGSPGAGAAFSPRSTSTRSSGSGGWLVLLFSVFLPLCIVGFVFVMIGISDGPLMGLWSRVNPVSFAAESMVFGGEGTGAGLFTDARAITVDPNSGNIYVAEYGSGRIQVFDPQGEFITQWSLAGSPMYIAAMAADRNGRVYVLGSSSVLVVEAATGSLVAQIESPDDFWSVDAMAVTASGELVVVSGDSIFWLNPQGEVVKSAAQALASVGDISSMDALAVDGVGNLFAIGTFTDAVFKFGPDGNFITRFGSDGDEPGQFRAPGPLAVDNQSRVYVSDMKGIQVFDPDGRYLALIPVKGYAFGLAFNDDNELFVVSNSQQVRKYTIKK